MEGSNFGVDAACVEGILGEIQEKKGLVRVIDTSMHPADMGMKYLSHNEENAGGVDVTVLGERPGTVTMVAASGEAGKTSSATIATYATKHNPSTAVHWWIFLRVNLAMVVVET